MTTQTVPVHGTKLSAKGRKAIIAGSIGNAVEFVDWSVYGVFSSVFAHHFFPKGEAGAVALLSTLAIFAVGFVMRPVGAAVMGPFADRFGRKKGLLVTIVLMAAATALIAISPTYEQVGILAPIILLLARLVQGFAAGGEFGSSSAFLVESAAPSRRAFAGSWQQVSVGAGVLVASGMGTLITSNLSDAALDSWGWRLAFLVASALGLLGIWLRVSIDETDSFEKGMENVEAQAEEHGKKRAPLFGLFVQHPGAALRVFGITIAGTLLYYMWVNYFPTYAHIAVGIPLKTTLLANVIGMVLFIVMLPFVGLLSDKIGRKATMAGFAGGFLLFSYPLFKLLEHSGGNFGLLLLTQVIGLIFLTGYSANCAVIMSEQFPPEVRATGIGLPYALAVALFGGTAPYITTWMNTNGIGGWVWLYCSIAAAIGLVVYLTMPETKGKVLDS